jgi:hypothetical protein
MARPVCVFCRRKHSATSEEDVFARWIAREYRAVKGLGWEVTSSNPNKPVIRVGGRAGKLGLVSRKPCSTCNNGWMSVLENRVKYMIAPMLKGVSLSLLTSAQLDIAKWAVKTAIMHELLQEPGERRYFKPHDRQSLYRDGIIPPDTNIYLARYIGQDHAGLGYAGIETKPYHLSIVLNNNSTHLPKVDGYSLTFRIDQFALQIFSFRRPKELDGRGQIAMRVNGNWSEAVVEIWPITGNRTWPPRYVLGDDMFPVFWKRWNPTLE